MALAFTQLGVIKSDTANGTSYAGTAGTPAAGDLLLAFVSGTGTVVAGGGTMTGTWTWNQIFTRTWNSNVGTLSVFAAAATAATSTTPTFDCTGDAATGCFSYCVRATGAEGQAQPYIRQIASNEGTGANPALTFGKAVLTGNGVIGFGSNGSNTAAQWTAPASWTEGGEVVMSTPVSSAEGAWMVSGETGTTITWTNAQTAAWTVVAIELYVAGTGPEMVDDTGASGFFGVQGAS